ncbi:MAG: hypothetical protein JNG84_06830 [Archangium sp.]|nr:hypothetical protein [Archangium sp.]
MALPRNVGKIRDIVVKAGLIDEMQLRSALAHLEQWGGTFSHALLELRFVDEMVLTQTISKALKVPVMGLAGVGKDAGALSRLDVRYCQDNLIFPVSLVDRTLTVAMADPTQLDVIDAVKSKTGCRVIAQLATESDILGAIQSHYVTQPGAPLNTGGRTFSHGVQQQNLARVSQAMADEMVFDPDAPSNPAMAAMMKRAPSANTLLDEMLADEVDEGGGLSVQELQRLETARAAQEKAGQILHALNELLREKGYLA